MIDGNDDDVLRLEALSQSLGFVANCADEVAAALKTASPDDRRRLDREILVLRHAVRRLTKEVRLETDGD